MKKVFNWTIYQEQVDQFLKKPSTIKIVDTSFAKRSSTQDKLSDWGNVYFVSEEQSEFRNYNVATSSSWKEYSNNLLPPYVDGAVIKFRDNNPYNLKWLWRTDGSTFVTCGDITAPGISGKYQPSLYSESEIKNNQYVTGYTNFKDSTLQDEIRYASYWISADIGGVACTGAGEYKICLRGPAGENADFKEWLVSITNHQSVILAEDSKLIISIAVSGGMAKPFYLKWDKLVNKIQKFFKFDSTNFK